MALLVIDETLALSLTLSFPIHFPFPALLFPYLHFLKKFFIFLLREELEESVISM